MKQRIKTIKWLAVVCVSVFGGVILTNGCFADDVGGGYIAPGGAGGGCSSSSGGICHTTCDPSDESMENELVCAGFSWIFYETQLSEDEPGKAIKITPDTSKIKISDGHTDWPRMFMPGSDIYNPELRSLLLQESGPVIIPEQCSEHEGGGFWHFGRNYKGVTSEDSNGNAFFVDYAMTKWFSVEWNAYSASKYKWGHTETYKFGQYTGSKSPDVSSWVPYYPKSPISHELYIYDGTIDGYDNGYIYGYNGNYKLVYKATKSSSIQCGDNDTQLVDCNTGGSRKVQAGEVWEDFKKLYGVLYPGSSEEDMRAAFEDAPAFCYWPGIDEPDEPTYYARSRAYLGAMNVETLSSGPIAEADTRDGDSSSATAENSEPVYLQPGNQRLTFLYNAYASESKNSVNWRTYFSESGLGSFDFNNSGTINLDEAVTYNGHNYFTSGPDRPVTTWIPNESLDIGEHEICGQLRVDDDNDEDNGAKATSTACAKLVVPYNFFMAPDLSLRHNNNVNENNGTYAGETVAITKASIKVDQVVNSLIYGEPDARYATKAENVKVMAATFIASPGSPYYNLFQTSGAQEQDDLIASWRYGYLDASAEDDFCNALDREYATGTVVYEGLCNAELVGSYDVLNSNNNPNGEEINVNLATTSNVYDVSAGSVYCVVLGVSPARSQLGGPGMTEHANTSSAGFDYGWNTTIDCTRVAKRPSLQVLGGGLFANYNIRTPASTKYSLDGVEGFEYNLIDKTRGTVFGSWVEQSVIANGKVNGLASGAGTGKVTNLGGTTVEAPVYASYEGNNVGYCTHRTSLSFANAGTFACGGISRPVTGSAGIFHEVDNDDRKQLVSYLVEGMSGQSDTTSHLYLENPNSYEEKEVDGRMIRYTKWSNSSTPLSIYRSEIGKNVTHVVIADGNVNIDGNIMYSSENLESLENIPKLIIYGKNIKIQCNVTRVDAILITGSGGDVDTCRNANVNSTGNINEREFSNQLTINGQIIADTLTPRRTYGAATGLNSGVPAEIINYDSSTILWSRISERADENVSTNNFTSVYRRELAPRI